ncbi:WXG100 family type VII secretion target [Amycolatopsis sp. NBC_01480]|uniref:WXG100 family type VII secretion target n=1 Tax=Amycolatopsis sp. NBC_01480 TaxID=2903562 RepID=UPI002E28F8C6|nr:terpene synthase family protein [Amycolatopsis sp. NBC_01480]
MTGGGSDFSHADDILDRMGATTGGLRAVMAELESTVEQDLAAWPAEARARYNAAKQEWTEALARMPECLDRARDAFEEIADSSGPGAGPGTRSETGRPGTEPGLG